MMILYHEENDMKTEMTTFNFRLTTKDRNYLDLLAGMNGVSSGRFLAKLIRREILEMAAEIAKTAVTRATAKKFGIPENIAESLKKPEDLETIMEPEKYRMFFDECHELLMNEVTRMKNDFDTEEFAD
jgi:hypothetical protein